LRLKDALHLAETLEILERMPNAMINTGQICGTHNAGLGALGTLHTQAAGIGKELTDKIITRDSC